MGRTATGKIEKHFPQAEQFTCENGNVYEIRWVRNEYRAFIYRYGGWNEAKLGSGNKENLINYIKSINKKEETNEQRKNL